MRQHFFNAGVPEKLIRDVTGHRSNALQLYERPTLQQRRAVSSVVVQGKALFSTEKENDPPATSTEQRYVTTAQPASTSGFGSLFSGFSHCSVNICPQNFVVNVGSAVPFSTPASQTDT